MFSRDGSKERGRANDSIITVLCYHLIFSGEILFLSHDARYTYDDCGKNKVTCFSVLV